MKRVTVDTAKGEAGRMQCQRALTRKRTLRGGGAPERGDLRLLEDSSECRGALGSNIVGSETASEGRIRAVIESACQGALTQQKKQTRFGGGALQDSNLRLLEDGSERRGALNSKVVA